MIEFVMDRLPKFSSRREFLKSSGVLAVGTSVNTALLGQANVPEPIIDIHQHVNYSGRLTPEMLAHQVTMGITKTVLLPAGTPVELGSTHNGESNGLAARITGNIAARKIVKAHPNAYAMFANEVPDLPNAPKEIEKYLRLGAIGIGELKFNIESDSNEMLALFDLAKAYEVPVLLHFQHGTYNHGFERFYKVLRKYPTVNFIGHAQTWWGNIDKDHNQEVMYPETKVTPGGITDKLLSDYPNMFGDLSAGSGQNALTRDEEHAKAFLLRHQDKLLYGSDCSDAVGKGEACTGAGTIALVRKLSASKEIERKILFGNAKKLMKL